MNPLAKLWPPYGVRVTVITPQHHLTLRAITDTDLPEIASIEPEDIYGPDIPDHAFPWIFQKPTQRAYSSLQLRWLNRANMSGKNWSFDFAAYENETLIGVADLRAVDYCTNRTIETGSWNYFRHQGKGYGTLIRHGLAELCFHYFKAAKLQTAWLPSNIASGRVSEKLGYVHTGETETPVGPEAKAKKAIVAQLSAQRYQRGYINAPQISVTGVTPQLLALLGVDALPDS